MTIFPLNCPLTVSNRGCSLSKNKSHKLAASGLISAHAEGDNTLNIVSLCLTITITNTCDGL